MPCLAFALQEAAHVNVWKNRLLERGLPVGPWLRSLKDAVVERRADDHLIQIDESATSDHLVPLGSLRDVLTVAAGQKIAYVTDTADTPANRAAIVALVQNADILFIEAAFAGADAALARERAHLTTTAAGEIAREANVRRVEPFHFSPRYGYKGINYRMSPENAACLAAAKIDCCVLANNHVLDWGRSGLRETLATLEKLNIKAAGAGRNDREARAPAVLNLDDGRLLIFSFGSTSSGVPIQWAATGDTPGVNVLPDLSEAIAFEVADQIMARRKPGDLIVVSIHWGSNWGYYIPDEHTIFARTLIDKAGVSIVHGHSSHHPKAIEIYRDSLILYGCCDFLNDYEGIRGYERYRDDLVLMYFADLDPTSGGLHALKLLPLQIGNFRLSIPSWRDIQWIQQTLDGECQKFGTRTEP
jgi:poly-gamma-glutamate synthesis protein (capsule biosynthesis protein)